LNYKPSLKSRARQSAIPILGILSALLLLSGCLEQVHTPHTSTGSLHNFLLHLEYGEVDDARAYLAPGLVTPSPELDQSMITASERVRRYEIEEKSAKSDEEQKTLTVPLGNDEVQETLRGRVRLRPHAGQPTPGPEEGWQDADIITAHMVVRGPGWRILDFDLKCCP